MSCKPQKEIDRIFEPYILPSMRTVLLSGLVLWVSIANWAGPGDPDPSFISPEITGGAPTTVFAISVQGDGKILVGGNFTHVAGEERRGLARLEADGTLDKSFAATDVPLDVRALAIQADGNILVGVGYAG